MRRKVQAIATAVIIGSIMMPTNVFAGEVSQNNYEVSNEAISPRISVSKYVEIKVHYPLPSYVPENYYYSYYDHDYKTELHGLLPLVDSYDSATFTVAVFAGYCSGSI